MPNPKQGIQEEALRIVRESQTLKSEYDKLWEERMKDRGTGKPTRDLIKEKDDAEKKLWTSINGLQKKLPDGLCVGKLVQFPRGDGSALYLVLDVKARTCKLGWLPLGDAWHEPYIVDERGMASRRAVEMSVGRADGLRRLFGGNAG